MKFRSLIFLFALTACTKTTERPLPLPSESASLAIRATRSPADNPTNPYDYVGSIHNQGLREIFHYSVSTGDTTRSGKEKFLHAFFKKEFNVVVKQQYDHQLEKSLLKNYKVVQQSLRMSDQANTFLLIMNESIDRIKSLDHYDELKKTFIEIENNIQSSSLGEHEMTSLLVTASIMRHSAFFWMDFANNNEKVSTMGLLRKIAGVITGIAADGTSALYYMFTSANIFAMLESSIEMSEMCGFYTGGFSYW